MRKRFLLSLLVALLTTLSLHAYDFQSGDLYYDITSDTTMEVTYQEQWSASNYQGLTTATIPETVTYNGTTYSVTSIGRYAFWYCSSLTSIILPNSVTSIGNDAFRGCSSLTSVTIGNSVTSIGRYAFQDCSSLTSIILPNSVTTIGYAAFASCYALTSITIPNYVISIGEYAFEYCSSLTSINIPNSVISIGEYAFSGCDSLTSIVVESGNTMYDSRENCNAIIETASNTLIAGCQSTTIPNSVTSIGRAAFRSCTSLASITLPNSVTSIEQSAFSGCSSLTSITLPNSVTSIGNYTFSDCSSLTSVTLGNSVTSIGMFAFSDCSSLTSITIPNSVTSIGNYTFSDCSSLTSVTLGNSVTSIGNRVFSGCSSLTTMVVESGNTTFDSRENCNAIIETATNTLIAGCQSTTIPNSVTSIGERAFYNCSSLISITIPNSVTSIGGGAFYNVPNIVYNGTSTGSPWGARSVNGYVDGYFVYADDTKTHLLACSAAATGEITLPNSVTSIGDNAFYDCSSLTSVTIGNSVTSIGEYAFYGCTSLPVEDNLRYADRYLVEAVDKSLSTYTIKAGTKWIGSSAFSYCSDITSITIPNSVTSIGNYAFSMCSSLTSVTSLSCTPPSCGSDVFNGTPSEKTLVVPSISMDAYKNSSTWKEFTSFESIVYPSITLHSSDSTLGIAQIDQEVDCDSVAIISAVGNLGYAFTQWSDGNTDNPRTIKLTQHTTLTAEFGLAYSGKCGDKLYWTYSNQEIKITGSGAMYNYTDSTMPWTLLRDSIKTVRVGNNATSIGAYAFANTPKLAKLHIGTGVEDIGANAFAGCKRLYDIYCNPTYPPFAETNSFANYNVYIYVPCENLRDYTLDVVWGEFKFIECIGSEDVEVSGNEVTVSPSYEDATFTWPVTDNADTYSLVITKDGVTFCTLVFNAQGQLLSITFNPRRQNAPAAEGTTPATYAEMTANGFRFTVTGLDEGAAYAYTLTVRNAANTVLETYTGDFTTLSNTPTGINESASTGRGTAGQVEKIIRDGQVLIIRNGETYDMMGLQL